LNKHCSLDGVEPCPRPLAPSARPGEPLIREPTLVRRHHSNSGYGATVWTPIRSQTRDQGPAPPGATGTPRTAALRSATCSSRSVDSWYRHCNLGGARLSDVLDRSRRRASEQRGPISQV